MESYPFSTSIDAPPKGGFTWIDAIYVRREPIEVTGNHTLERALDSQRCLVNIDPSDQYTLPFRFRETYNLFSDVSSSGLFKTFANLGDDEDKILRFANRYGGIFLGGQRTVPVEVYEWNPLPNVKISSKDLANFLVGQEAGLDGESFPENLTTQIISGAQKFEEYMNQYGVSTAGSVDNWQYRSERMADAIKLWELIVAGNVPALREVIRYSITDKETLEISITYESGRPNKWGDEYGFTVEADTLDIGKLPIESLMNSPVTCGWVVLRKLINEYVGEHISPHLEFNENVLTMDLRARSLLRALWLQFSLAVSGNKKFGECINCGNYFELAPSVGRKGKSYCSTLCRSAAYRTRKKAQETEEGSK